MAPRRAISIPYLRKQLLIRVNGSAVRQTRSVVAAGG
jgi:hypothetical protein